MGWFYNHIYDTFFDLLCNGLRWFYDQGLLEESRVAIKRKLALNGTILTDLQARIAVWIDCNCMETCVPGAGPIGPGGPGQARWADTVQQAFYNGWKSLHGLKNQTMDTAHGLTANAYGSVSLRQNDLRLLGNSGVNGKMAALPFWAYGDSIYPQLSNVKSRGPHALPLKSLRVSVEWNYALVSHNLFRCLSSFDKLRLLSSDRVSKMYSVAIILKNCHVCLYGCQSMSYFDLTLSDDMLERYTRLV
jgi:hypothetical protein